MNTTNPTIEVHPRDGLVDAPLDVRLSGLQSNERVTVRAGATFEQAGTWSTSVTYEADDEGKLDLNVQAPVAGDFATADANGLIWSLRPDDPTINPRSLVGDLCPHELRIAAHTQDALLEQSIVRRAVAEDVTVVEVREPSLQANLFLPEGEGPFPTVLVLGGSGGGFPDRQAALFASHGMGAVSLAYFGVEGLPSELRQIPLEYFESALAWIAEHPLLENDRLAVCGTSRGGELALLLASRYPRIRAVVAYVPSSHVWGAISRLDDEEDRDRDFFAAWTHGGRAIPYAGRVRNDAVAPDANGVITLTPAYLEYTADSRHADPALIPVERIDGPVLLVSGKDDALWPSAQFGELITERARLNGFDFAIEHLSYSGAGHAIGAGYGPTTINQSYHPIRRAMIDLGGTPEGLANARAESWPRVLEFLRRHTSPHGNVSNASPPAGGSA